MKKNKSLEQIKDLPAQNVNLIFASIVWQNINKSKIILLTIFFKHLRNQFFYYLFFNFEILQS